jgi:hypothetical protein
MATGEVASSTREVHSVQDVGGPEAARDQRWVPVDQAIVDPARHIVPGITGKQ